MDEIDHSLAEALASAGRVSFADLATRVGLSGPATAERVRRLEERGVIRGYSARLDPGSLGRGLTAFVFVVLGGTADRAAFLARVAEFVEVVECHHLAGDDDYLVKVHVDGTHGLETFVSDQLRSIDGIARTRTTVVLSTALDRPVMPS